jgi:predicted nucleic acid-binding protein
VKTALSACVIDASVALKWLIDEYGAEAAAALLDGSVLLASDPIRRVGRVDGR